MKIYIVLPLIALALLSCETHTYEDIEENTVVADTVTYNAQAKVIIDANCITCHADGGSASFRPLTNYAEVKDAVLNTNLLERIQMQTGEPSVMPQSGRMPQGKIDIILQWNADGLSEN